MLGLAKSNETPVSVENNIYLNSIAPTANTIIYCLKVILYHIPLTILWSCFMLVKFVLSVVYFAFSFCFIHTPFWVVNFVRIYLEHTVYVIIDSVTWPLCTILGFKPIYSDENIINQFIHGNSNLSFALYRNALVQDVFWPIFLNALVLVTISFFIAALLVSFHKFLKLFHSKKLIFTVTPFKTLQKLASSLIDDLLWIVSVVENTIKTINDLISPITTLRDKNVKAEAFESGKRFIIQRGLKEYRQSSLKDIPDIATSVKSKFISALRQKMESSIGLREDKSNSASEPEDNNKPPSSRSSANDSFSKEGNDDSSVNNSINEINEIKDSMQGHRLRRFSSIELAEALPKDYFQNNSRSGEGTTLLPGIDTAGAKRMDTTYISDGGSPAKKKTQKNASKMDHGEDSLNERSGEESLNERSGEEDPGSAGLKKRRGYSASTGSSSNLH